VRSVQGKEITTVEGIGTADRLHPIQEAFIEENAVQCGFCASGMIVSAKALLDRNPQPTDAELKAEMADNLCRCGVYDRLLRAIKRAAGLPVDTPSYRQGLREDRAVKPQARVPAETDELPGSLMWTPDLDKWVRIDTDGTITIITGKAELGQDLRTSVAMIAADELDVPLERIRVQMADTARTPNEGYTAGSLSLETSGNAIRQAAAEARQIMLLLAQDELDGPAERLTVLGGVISDPDTGRSITYWDLFGGKRFDRRVEGIGQPKEPAEYNVVSHKVGRLDMVAKVTGGSVFVHDLDLPDMVHGRVVRPPDYRARLVSVDEAAATKMPGVLKVVRDGSFLGVIAEREEQAALAMKALKKSAVWETDIDLPPQDTLFDHLLSQPDQAFLLVDGAPVDDAIPLIEAPAEAAQTLEATYYRPYHAHASLGPSAAVAQMMDGKLTVWSHTQGVYPLRAGMASALGMARDDVRAIHLDGPGCYGHNGADDAALDAALLARALPGRPVSLKWTRSDEHSWEPYGPAAVLRMQASLNHEGRVMDWNHDVFGYTYMGRHRPGSQGSGLLAAWHLREPLPPFIPVPAKGPHVGIHRNADPIYKFPRKRVVKHFVPDSLLRTSSLRGLGSYANVFAIESFMDELAHAAGVDPIEFRLRHLEDERARAVIEAVAENAHWRKDKKARSDEKGQGFAFAQYKNRQSYVAVIVDLSVNPASGQISLARATLAADSGQIVNPEAVSSQLEGVFVQAASWTLKEQVSFDRHGIISVDWHSYPILRFRDAPKIDVVLLNQPGQPYLGVGEGAQGPVPAAIANAIFDAVGIRLRKIPFTPARVQEALNSLAGPRPDKE
jgi:CO/xanthine dehydrogenase Mo-binding subunit